MRDKVTLVLMTLAMMSCSREGMRSDRDLDFEYGRNIPHDMIVLGDRLENPYTTENMTKALNSLYPTKADRIDVKTTNLYVRFLPKDDVEYEMLKEMTPFLMDHPLDYDIVVEGDWYHDPEVPEGNVTWQYAVVPRDFVFPDISHEMIDECFIAENDPGTRADGIDWEAVEKESYRLTGNSDMLKPETKAEKAIPSGRITIVDEDYCEGKPLGVSGVTVSCNSFVKFAHATTDRDGYYEMDKTFSSDPRYRIVFRNEKGFSIGLNLVLVPASVSTLGKSSPEGVDMTVTKDSDEKLFRRCVVNNAAYDYISRCSPEDLDISLPPSDLRIWLFDAMSASSAVMMHHGAVVRSNIIEGFLGRFSSLLEFFLPDLTIGTKHIDNYKVLYSSTCHELAHASHFANVGTSYWDNYIRYILESFIATGGMTYGNGDGAFSGHCEIGEMWAYYLESKIFKERYGGGFPSFGTSYWFFPQIFRYLDDRGIETSEIFSVLEKDVTSLSGLKAALTTSFPEDRAVIEQIFSRY